MHARRLATFAWLPLLAACLGVVLVAIGPGLPAAGSSQEASPAPGRQQIETAVRGYLYDWSPLTDPLVTLPGGIQVKSSNVNGIEVAGVRYYYRPRYGFSADPLTRAGGTGDYEIVLIMDPGTGYETEVYRPRR